MNAHPPYHLDGYSALPLRMTLGFLGLRTTLVFGLRCGATTASTGEAGRQQAILVCDWSHKPSDPRVPRAHAPITFLGLLV